MMRLFRQPRAHVAILLLAAAAGAGCTRAPRPRIAPPAPAPAAAPAPVAATATYPAYEALREPLAGRDLAPLRGRRVAVDPGHGGVFRGALGAGGLAEADVNLGVALALRDLLRTAGAEVLLTRDTDRDFLTPADSSLGADLGARGAAARAWQPDVFLSLHHNSTAPRDTSANETQTYYPVGRDGADLDLARAVHRHLARNLSIRPARILPGNYRVLREATAPAVLGEPSMISNPGMERRLAQPAKQALEAQAYFLGLLDYFAGGDPRWVPASGDTLRDPRGPLVWRFAPGGDAARPGPALDPASVTLTLDGAAQPVTVDPDGVTLRWDPPRPAPSGAHRLALAGRNLAGRATRDCALIWRESARDPRLTARLRVLRAPGESVGPRRAALLTWELRDQAGRLLPGRGGRLGPRDGTAGPTRSLPPSPDGRGYLRLPAAELPRAPELRVDGPDGIRARAPVERDEAGPAATATVCVLRAGAPWAPDAAVPGGAWRSRLPLPAWLAAAADPGLRDATAPLLFRRAGEPCWLEADGARPLVADSPPESFTWTALLPELVGLTVVLDPAGGGADSDGEPGPSGVRGSDLNLGVARALASLLRGAGARVVLTREDERWVAPEAKLRLTTQENADLCLVVRRAAAGETPFAARHHETSARGRRWARLFAHAVAPLAATGCSGGPAESLLVAPTSSYLLRQTACPALEAALPPPATGEREARLERPDHQAACARALLLATAALLAGDRVLDDALDPAALIAARPELFPAPARVRWARLDGNLAWLPPRWCRDASDTLSSPAAPGLPCGGPDHTLEVSSDDGWRLVVLRREAHGFTGRVVFSGAVDGLSKAESSPESGRR